MENKIASDKYTFSSMIIETVSLISTQIGKRTLRFFANIEGIIPNTLIGDKNRLQQILHTMLSNSVGHTEWGFVGLFITVEKQDEKQVWLKFTITDTGSGITPEEHAGLFGDSVQEDKKSFGLAIVKQLCAEIGGNISLESDNIKGCTFTMILPQGIEASDPFAIVEAPEKKKVLIYEGRSVYLNSMSWALEKMGVPNVAVTNEDDFSKALFREEWFYVFSGYGLYDRIKPLMERNDFPGGKKPPLALMEEFGVEDKIPDVHFFALPVQSLSIANVLNAKKH
jgi:two-component system sensor histidine kinase BarA